MRCQKSVLFFQIHTEQPIRRVCHEDLPTKRTQHPDLPRVQTSSCGHTHYWACSTIRERIFRGQSDATRYILCPRNPRARCKQSSLVRRQPVATILHLPRLVETQVALRALCERVWEWSRVELGYDESLVHKQPSVDHWSIVLREKNEWLVVQSSSVKAIFYIFHLSW